MLKVGRAESASQQENSPLDLANARRTKTRSFSESSTSNTTFVPEYAQMKTALKRGSNPICIMKRLNLAPGLPEQ
jgi:hypothetical protein